MATLQVFKVPEFQQIAIGRVFGVPFQVWIMLALVLIAAWALQRTVFGRQVLAVGGNEQAAWLAGVPVRSVKRMVYVISGVCSGIAGLIVIAMNSAADANLIGMGIELDAIAAVAVGGTLLSGGQGDHHRHAARCADHPAGSLYSSRQWRSRRGGPRGQGRTDRARRLAAKAGSRVMPRLHASAGFGAYFSPSS
jgi:hypothetical protein